MELDIDWTGASWVGDLRISHHHYELVGKMRCSQLFEHLMFSLIFMCGLHQNISLDIPTKRVVVVTDTFRRAYAARGVYRRMVVVPTMVSGQVCYYRDATKPLLQSDMDKLWSVKVEDNILKGTHVFHIWINLPPLELLFCYPKFFIHFPFIFMSRVLPGTFCPIVPSFQARILMYFLSLPCRRPK